jgi:hypothetical protein
MDSNATRSKQVIKNFKKRKLAKNALNKIQRLIASFDEDRKSNIRWAKVGLIALTILLLLALLVFFFGTTKVTIT